SSPPRQPRQQRLRVTRLVARSGPRIAGTSRAVPAPSAQPCPGPAQRPTLPERQPGHLMRTPILLSVLVAAVVAGGYSVARATQQGQRQGLRETVNGITYHMPYGRPTRPFTPAVQVGDL